MARVSPLNSAQARQISIFTCGVLAVFAWLPPSHKSPPLRRACAERQKYQPLRRNTQDHIVAAKYRSKIEGHCALVCGRVAEFVLAQLSGAQALGEQRRAPELLARATIQTDYGIDLGPAADNLLAVVLVVGGAPE